MYEKITCCVIGSPGFVRDNFMKHMQAHAIKTNSDFLKSILTKIVLAPCSSGFKHSLNELMGSQVVKERIQAMSCMGEASSLEEFFRLAEMDMYRVTYGPKSVTLALDQMMIKTLFISDKLFRAKNAEQRKYYVDLYTKAKKQGVEIVQFGAMTPNGNRLNGMTGIAAILRMAMPDLDDLLESSDEGDIDSDNESGMCEVIPSDSESIQSPDKKMSDNMSS